MKNKVDNSFKISNNMTVDECLDYIKELEDGSLVRFYDYVFQDEKLKIYGRNAMQESPEIIRLWKQIGLDYNISKDKYFFLYALCLLLKGENLQYDLCFLYAEDKSLREDTEFNELLKNISKLHINEFTDERHITKEEKIKENNGLGMCPFGDAMGSAGHLCKKYNHKCIDCQNGEYIDKLYTSFFASLKLINIQRF